MTRDMGEPMRLQGFNEFKMAVFWRVLIPGVQISTQKVRDTMGSDSNVFYFYICTQSIPFGRRKMGEFHSGR